MIKCLLAAMLLMSFTGVSFAADEPIINTKCPVCEKEVSKDNPPTVKITVGEGDEAHHMKIATCSSKCCDEFKKDPVKSFQKHFQKPGAGTTFKP